MSDTASDDEAIDERSKSGDVEPEPEKDKEVVADVSVKEVVADVPAKEQKAEEQAVGKNPANLELNMIKYIQAQSDEAIDEKLAAPFNKIWNFKPNPALIKKIAKAYKKPENIDINRVEINQELMIHLKPIQVKRDTKLRACQNAIMRTAYPLMAVAQSVYEFGNEALFDKCLETFALLADANSHANALRRDAIKSQIAYRYKNVCTIPKDEDTSKLLFGETLPIRIKAATDAAKLGRFHPYVRPTPYNMHRGRGYSRGKLKSFDKDRFSDMENINTVFIL